MSNLRDVIREAIINNELEEKFTPSQVRGYIESKNDLSRRYNLNHVGTILANWSVGPRARLGESVQTPSDAHFIRHERGLYSLNDDDYENESDDSNTPSLEDGNELPVNTDTKTGMNEICEKFVDYFKNRPFCYLKKGKGRSKDSWQPRGGAVVGWENRLKSYEWNGGNWEKTRITLKDFEDRLIKLLESPNSISQENALNIYNDIKKWGNPKGVKRNGKEIVEHLLNLLNNVITEVDSTLTKVYALAKPNEYVIYDSRVAAAILTVAEYMYPMRTKINKREDAVENFQCVFPALGLYGGEGGTRPRAYRNAKWPISYRVVEAQNQANRLCKGIQEILNKSSEGGRSNWTLREIEAVLFMEGY